jgi:hypothetical protein
LTTPEVGAVEFDGTNLYYTDNTATPVRRTVVNLVGAQTLQNKTFGAGNTWQGNIIAPAFLGTGTANASTFLSGDGTYKGLSPGTILFISNITTAPLSSTAAGTKGEVRVVGADRYECININVWIKSTVVTTF